MTLLRAEDVTVHFTRRSGGESQVVRAVDGVDLLLARGESLGLVGESGSGKSTLARAVAQLVPLTAGRVVFEGVDLGTLDSRALRAVRSKIRFVFQDPYGSLNPRMRVGTIVAQPLRIHRQLRRGEQAARVAQLLEQVGLHPSVAHRYPHEFSGGQRQRVAIARALALDPALIVLDEPVSALDVSVQAQILALLRRLQHDLGAAYLFISHDLAVVRHVAERIAVMYAGRIVEAATSDELFRAPAHPYTQALLSAVPTIGATEHVGRPRIRLQGEPPDPAAPPTGCRFRTRCWKADARCAREEPALSLGSHSVACHHPDG